MNSFSLRDAAARQAAALRDQPSLAPEERNALAARERALSLDAGLLRHPLDDLCQAVSAGMLLDPAAYARLDRDGSLSAALVQAETALLDTAERTPR